MILGRLRVQNVEFLEQAVQLLYISVDQFEDLRHFENGIVSTIYEVHVQIGLRSIDGAIVILVNLVFVDVHYSPGHVPQYSENFSLVKTVVKS